MTADWAKRFFERALSSQRWDRQDIAQLSRDGRRFDTDAGFSLPIMRYFHSLFVLISSCLIFCESASGQSLELVLDLNPGARGSSPSFLTPFRGDIYFRANSGLQNVELWRFDGTTAAQVADINPTGSSTPTDLTVADDTLFFAATDGTGRDAALVLERHRRHEGRRRERHQPAARHDRLQRRALLPRLELRHRGHRALQARRRARLPPSTSIPAPAAAIRNNLPNTTARSTSTRVASRGRGASCGATTARRSRRPGRISTPATARARRGCASIAASSTFPPYDGIHGNELWRFDGTTLLELVADHGRRRPVRVVQSLRHDGL